MPDISKVTVGRRLEAAGGELIARDDFKADRRCSAVGGGGGVTPFWARAVKAAARACIGADGDTTSADEDLTNSGTPGSCASIAEVPVTVPGALPAAGLLPL